MPDDLDIIEPEQRTVTFGGTEIPVRPLRVGQIPGVTRALRGVAIGEDIDIMALIAEHGDAVIDAMAIATGMKRAEIEEGDPAEFIELARAVIEVNADFFIARLGPTIRAAIGTALSLVENVKDGIGATPSKP